MAEDQQAPSTFGPNAWLVDEMYEQYRQDPSSVSESWQEFFADYRPTFTVSNGGGAASAADARAPQAPPPAAAPDGGGAQTRTHEPASGTEAANTGPASELAGTSKASLLAGTPLRGAAARIVENMERSLAVPTATSFRQVPARLLEVNRKVLNNHLMRSRGG